MSAVDAGVQRDDDPDARPGDERADRQWLAELRSSGRDRELAAERLHVILLRVAHAELNRRCGQHPLTGPELDDLAHQAADDAVVAVIAKAGSFRGESRFLTWACKFAILEVSAKLGRHFWRRPSAALSDEDWDRLPDRFGVAPEEQAQHRDLVAALRQAVDSVLSVHQRQVFVALVVDGVPLDALVIELGSSRGAVYKTMYDARSKLRTALVADGLVAP